MENANVSDPQASEQSSKKDERQRNSPSSVILQEGRIRERKGPCASSNRNELENENLEKADVPLTENVAMEIDCPSTSNSKTNAGPSETNAETNVGSQLKENARSRKKMLSVERKCSQLKSNQIFHHEYLDLPLMRILECLKQILQDIEDF